MSQQNIIPKGPKGYPYLGSLLNFASPNRLAWLSDLKDKHGDVFKFTLLQEEYYLINHPDYVKEIMTSKMAQYSKDTGGFHTIKKVLGESVFTSMGDVWKRKRALAQPQFHKKKINNLSSIMTDTTEEMLERWEKKYQAKQAIDIKIEMMEITLGVVTKALFSTGLSKEEFQTVVDVFTPILLETNRRALYPFKFMRYFKPKQNQAYKDNIDTLDQIIFGIIEKRKTSSEEYTDLLQMFMDAKEEGTGEPLTDVELRDEIMTVFIAGHETTANALSWLWIVLAQQPAIRIKVEQEVAEVLGDRIPQVMDFPKLTYTLNVFKEILRLYPPVPMIPRKVEKDDHLGPFFIKANGTVFISPYFLHRHPDFWENPEEFDPSRFEKNTEKRQHPFAYLPFGGGPRICVGINFAYMEAVFIIAMVVQRFRLALPPNNKDIEAVFELTYRPKGEVNMHLIHRV